MKMKKYITLRYIVFVLGISFLLYVVYYILVLSKLNLYNRLPNDIAGYCVHALEERPFQWKYPLLPILLSYIFICHGTINLTYVNMLLSLVIFITLLLSISIMLSPFIQRNYLSSNIYVALLAIYSLYLFTLPIFIKFFVIWGVLSRTIAVASIVALFIFLYEKCNNFKHFLALLTIAVASHPYSAIVSIVLLIPYYYINKDRIRVIINKNKLATIIASIIILLALVPYINIYLESKQTHYPANKEASILMFRSSILSSIYNGSLNIAIAVTAAILLTLYVIVNRDMQHLFITLITFVALFLTWFLFVGRPSAGVFYLVMLINSLSMYWIIRITVKSKKIFVKVIVIILVLFLLLSNVRYIYDNYNYYERIASYYLIDKEVLVRLDNILHEINNGSVLIVSHTKVKWIQLLAIIDGLRGYEAYSYTATLCSPPRPLLSEYKQMIRSLYNILGDIIISNEKNIVTIYQSKDGIIRILALTNTGWYVPIFYGYIPKQFSNNATISIANNSVLIFTKYMKIKIQLIENTFLFDITGTNINDKEQIILAMEEIFKNAYIKSLTLGRLSVKEEIYINNATYTYYDKNKFKIIINENSNYSIIIRMFVNNPCNNIKVSKAMVFLNNNNNIKIVIFDTTTMTQIHKLLERLFVLSSHAVISKKASINGWHIYVCK